MLDLPGYRLVLIFLVALGGGAVNSIAGGGTLLTFPALVGAGVPALMANATNTVALWPGALSSMWGYRRSLAGTRRWLIGLAVPSAAGGLCGALLLLRTDGESFEAIVPWLVLGATLLFMLQRPVLALARGGEGRRAGGLEGREPAAPSGALAAYQFAVAVYGGYFGAGIGILMLAALGFMGFTHIHRMNGVKNWAGLWVNCVAAVTFVASGLVHWPVAMTMAAGAIAGGYAGARLAQRVSQQRVRQAIVAVGFGSGVWLLLR
jgi:uncharacterized membrane protein YfcA